MERRWIRGEAPEQSSGDIIGELAGTRYGHEEVEWRGAGWTFSMPSEVHHWLGPERSDPRRWVLLLGFPNERWQLLFLDRESGEAVERQNLELSGVPCALTRATDGSYWVATMTFTHAELYRLGQPVRLVSQFPAEGVDSCALAVGDDFVSLATTTPRAQTSIGPMSAVELRTIDVASGRIRGEYAANAIGRSLQAVADDDGAHHVVWRDWSTYHFNVWRIEDPTAPDPARHLFTRYFVEEAHLEVRSSGPMLAWRGNETDPGEGEVPLCHGAANPQPLSDAGSPALGMTIMPAR